MKKFYAFFTAAALAVSCAGAVPVSAEDSVTITPKAVLASSVLKAIVASDTPGAYAYQWLEADVEEGPYTPIYGAQEETYTVSAQDKNKYLTVEVTNGDSGAVTRSAESRSVTTLGPVGAAKFSEQHQAQTPQERIFQVDGKGFILLDEYLRDTSAFYIMAEDCYGMAVFDQGGITKFDPEIPGNIGHFLNHDFLASGNEDNGGVYRLPEGILSHIDQEHLWWCEAGAKDGPAPEDYYFTGGVGLLSMSEAVKYQGRYGWTMEGDSSLWWLRTQRGVKGTPDSMYAMVPEGETPGALQEAQVTEAHGVRPVFYLDRDFFTSVKLDVERLGADVKAMLVTRYEARELEGLYTPGELIQLGYPQEPGTVLSEAAIRMDTQTVGANTTLTAFMEVSGAVEYQYQWLEKDAAQTEYRQIRSGKTAEYYVTALDKNKELTCDITPVFAGGALGEAHRVQEPVFVEKLGLVQEIRPSAEKREACMLTPEENKFTVEGSTKNYVLLDTFDDPDSTFYILADFDTGVVEQDTVDPGQIDPARESSIGYWLNNAFAKDGYEIAGVQKEGMEKQLYSYVNQNHEWWCEAGVVGDDDPAEEDYSFTAGIGLLSQSEALKYLGVYGWSVGTDHGGWPLHWWTRTGSAKTDRYFCVQNSTAMTELSGIPLGRIVTPSNGHDELSPRPAFYLKKSFFADVKLSYMGENVKKAIQQTYTISELLGGMAGYKMEDLIRLGLVTVPRAEQVAMTGAPKVNGILNGTYTYAQESGKAEGASDYGFEVCDTVDGEFKVIARGTKAHTVTAGEQGNYIRFYTVPKDSDGVEGARVTTKPVYILGTATLIPLEAVFLSQSGTPASSLSSCTSLRPRIKIKNTGPAQDGVVMLFLYDKEHRAIANKAVRESFAAGEEKIISGLTMALPAYTEGSYAKIFVLDGLGTMNSVLGYPAVLE